MLDFPNNTNLTPWPSIVNFEYSKEQKWGIKKKKKQNVPNTYKDTRNGVGEQKYMLMKTITFIFKGLMV